MIIRKAVIGDTRELARLAIAAWDGAIRPLFEGTPGYRRGEHQRLLAYAHRAMDQIIVAEDAGMVLGWCSNSCSQAYIAYLFVDPQYQGLGIGSALLRRMETMFELQGRRTVQLQTLADHLDAVHFYERQGYSILAVKHDGRSHGHPLMSIRLEKKLCPLDGPFDDTE